MSDKELDDSVKDEKTAMKSMEWAASQESSSSNDSILNYDIHAKSAVKPAKWPASQESFSSNDSILDYDIFSSKKPKAARSRETVIEMERGSLQSDRKEEVIDLSLDDGDDQPYWK